MSKQQDEVFETLDQWLQVLNNDLIELRSDQYIFKEIQAIWGKNPKAVDPPRCS